MRTALLALQPMMSLTTLNGIPASSNLRFDKGSLLFEPLVGVILSHRCDNPPPHRCAPTHIVIKAALDEPLPK